MNDQTIKADAGKLELCLVPTQIIRDIAEVRMYGNAKYGDSESWRRVEIERYRNAAFRHFLAYIDDPESVDEESGILHRKHLSCNLAFLAELEGRNGVKGKKKGDSETARKNPCYGCFFWRPLYDAHLSEWCCHYAIEMQRLRRSAPGKACSKRVEKPRRKRAVSVI